MKNGNNRAFPNWFDGRTIDEAAFCESFRAKRRIVYSGHSFFTPDGRIADEGQLRAEIYDTIKYYSTQNIARTVNNIVEALKLSARDAGFTPCADRIHFANGTLHLNGTFVEGKDEVVRSRFPIRYDEMAKLPERWLTFLCELLHKEDILTLQEYIGYCLIPSTKGQRMMVIKGSGGEGKSQIGAVLSYIFGENMKDGSLAKISENRFARADLENIHLMVDDDMKTEALRQTNYVKSIVTSNGRMDLERKGQQSYQGWMYARLLAFSNSDLQALYDRSNGFYRRQLIITTKDKSPDRVDDPHIAEKLCAEAEGIVKWAVTGLRRLIANDFRFTESERITENREEVRRDANNVLSFMESEGYIRRDPTASVSSKELYAVYKLWCDENVEIPVRPKTFTALFSEVAGQYNINYSGYIVNQAGRRVRGFSGIEKIANVPMMYYKD